MTRGPVLCCDDCEALLQIDYDFGKCSESGAVLESPFEGRTPTPQNCPLRAQAIAELAKSLRIEGPG